MATRSYIYFSENQGHAHAHAHAPTNLTFEFNEFDVWNMTSSPEFQNSIMSSRSSKNLKKMKKMEDRVEVIRSGSGAISLPVDVPDWGMILKQDVMENIRSDDDGYDFEFSDDDVDGDDEMVPPHEYLARLRTMSFSVHEGIGRTLKGRDLRKVRNAVWKRTGFED